MTTESRRSFLGKAGTATMALATSAFQSTRAAGANDRLVLGMIGCGGRSSGLISGVGGSGEFAYVCDPDENHARRAQNATGAKHVVSDLRRVLDDQSVDAVFIATPDHWHAPAAILACEAGKHVYVEKPCSHNLRESRLLLDAARRNKVVVQHGTQSRSNKLIAGAVQMLRDGVIGDVLVAKAWNIQRRRNIGHGKPTDPPPGVNYDLWVGPAEMVPFQKNRFHYDWHWWYNFGTGDLGNDGTHEIDYARWGLGVTGLPSLVSGTGGKYFFDDDQQFPDTATCTYEWPGDGKVGSRRQLIFEMRIWSTSYPYNCDSGAEFFGTKGRMFVSKRGKLEIYADRNKPIKDAKPSIEPAFVGSHQQDFLDAISQNRRPQADIAIAHDSVALVHLGNLAVRLGRSLAVDPKQETIINDADANELLSRKYRQGGHWSIPNAV